MVEFLATADDKVERVMDYAYQRKAFLRVVDKEWRAWHHRNAKHYEEFASYQYRLDFSTLMLSFCKAR